MRVPRPDLVLHFVAGNICVAAGIVASVWVPVPAYILGVVLAIAAGIAREIYNEVKTKSADVHDLIYTVAGAVPTSLALLIHDAAKVFQ